MTCASPHPCECSVCGPELSLADQLRAVSAEMRRGYPDSPWLVLEAAADRLDDLEGAYAEQRVARLDPLAQWCAELSRENEELKERLRILDDAYEDDVMRAVHLRADPLP